MSFIDVKQIKGLAVQSFPTSVKADAWLAQYAEPTNTPNKFVFYGVRYTDRSTGLQYEAVFSPSAAPSGRWVWVPVESGGANIFLTGSSSPKAGKLAEPVDATKKVNLLPALYPDVYTEIKVDDGEAVTVTFEWDGGRDYFGEYKIYTFDANNQLLDTLTVSNGASTDTVLNGASAEVAAVNATISAADTSDRRFQYAGVSFDTTKGTDQVAYFRIVGNGGVSDNLRIVRASLAAPVSVVSFDNIDSRAAVTGLSTADHTHVRGSQTYTLEVGIDYTTTAFPSGATADNIPQTLEISGESVNGTYTVDLTTLPGYLTAASTAQSGATVHTFLVPGIPATTSSVFNDQERGVQFVAINADNAQSTSLARGANSTGFGTPSAANATNGFDFDFSSGNAGNGFGAVSGVPIDNALIAINNIIFTYPFYTQATSSGVRQLALKTADTTRLVADRARIQFDLSEGLANGTDSLTIVGDGSVITGLDNSADTALGAANVLVYGEYDGVTSGLTANVAQVNSGTPGLVSGATGAGGGSIIVTARKAKNDSQRVAAPSGIRVIDVAPVISSSTPNVFRADGTQTLTFDQTMRYAIPSGVVTDGTNTIVPATVLGGITNSTTGTVSVTVSNATVRAVYNNASATPYQILGYNVAGFDIAAPGLNEELEVRGFPLLAYDPKGASVGSGADFDLVPITGNDWYIQLPGNVEVSSASFGSNAGPSTGSPSSLSIGTFTIQTSFAVSAVVTNYTGDPQRVKFTADGSLQTAINNAAAPPATGLTVEETI